MLTQMTIRNLGVITASVVDFSSGFTVLTGETGAGKTMLITGLDLLLGGRADAGSVRAGADQASVEGVFVVEDGSVVAARAREAGADLDPVADPVAAPQSSEQPPTTTANVELALARTIASRRSRAHAGGRTVPAAVLAELGEELVAVHGQSEQVLLRSPARQRQLLDTFAGAALTRALAAYQQLFSRLAETRAQLATLSEQVRQRRQEADLLRLGLAEIDAAAPQPGEDRDLRLVAERLEHAAELLTSTNTAHAALVGAEDTLDAGRDVLALLEVCRRHLESVARIDPALGQLAARAQELGHLVVDLAADISSYAAGVEADPARLDRAHARRAELQALLRKYGDDIDAVLAWASRAGLRLAELDGDDGRIEQLSELEGQLSQQVTSAAEKLTAARRAAAQRLEAAVSVELRELSMPGAGLAVQLAERPPGRHGADEVTFLLTPHRGAPPRPLAKGASGGELSRVMLAIEVATLDHADPRTLVFDEVDSGVGGRAAVQIGRRLARLARHAQVIVVTHLPQVAAFADQHLVVAKWASDGVTLSEVHAVDGEDRLRELSRMLAGVEDSDAARQHSRELLEQAAAERAGAGAVAAGRTKASSSRRR